MDMSSIASTEQRQFPEEVVIVRGTMLLSDKILTTIMAPCAPQCFTDTVAVPLTSLLKVPINFS